MAKTNKKKLRKNSSPVTRMANYVSKLIKGSGAKLVFAAGTPWESANLVGLSELVDANAKFYNKVALARAIHTNLIKTKRDWTVTYALMREVDGLNEMVTDHFFIEGANLRETDVMVKQTVTNAWGDNKPVKPLGQIWIVRPGKIAEDVLYDVWDEIDGFLAESKVFDVDFMRERFRHVREVAVLGMSNDQYLDENDMVLEKGLVE